MKYTYESVLKDFNNRVKLANSGLSDKEQIERNAWREYHERFKDLLHPSVVDPYSKDSSKEDAERANSIKAHMAKVWKKRDESRISS